MQNPSYTLRTATIPLSSVYTTVNCGRSNLKTTKPRADTVQRGTLERSHRALEVGSFERAFAMRSDFVASGARRRPRRTGVAVVALLAAMLSASALPATSAQAQVDTTRGSKVQRWVYPPTPSVDIVERRGGVDVHDRYRWLEALGSDDVLRWSRQQDSLTRAVLAEEVPDRDRIASRLASLAAVTDHSVPLLAAGHAFYLRLEPGQRTPMLVVEPAGKTARVLVDPNRSDDSESASVVEFAPSSDGRRVAYVLRRAERRELRVVDVPTGRDLGVSIADARISQRPWGADGTSMIYATPSAMAGDSWQVRSRSLRDGGDVVAFERSDLEGWLLEARTGDQGHRLVVTATSGAGATTRIFVRTGSANPVELLAGKRARHRFIGNDDDRLFLQTDLDAPRGRVVAVDGRTPDAIAATVVESGDETLQHALRVGGHLLLHTLEAGRPRALLHRLSGERVHDVELPLGLIWTDYLERWDGFAGGPAQDAAFFRFLGLSAPRTIFRVDATTGSLTIWKGPGPGAGADGFVTRRVEYASADGTVVPMILTHRADRVLDGHAPTLIYGYGAFGWTAQPFFNPKYRLFLELGGVHAMPALRGGGTNGTAWHEAGTGRLKQNTIDDLIAAAEWLVQSKYTSPDRIVVEGNSAGGVAVGGAITQRPDLFGVAVIEVPLADLARLHTHTSWLTPEFGDPTDPEDLRAMLSYSPFHSVRPGVKYPATLITAGDEDRVAPPWHAYKLTAALQAAQPRSRPHLIRIDWGTGHGGEKSQAQRVGEWTDELAFMLWQLGLTYDGVGPAQSDTHWPE